MKTSVDGTGAMMEISDRAFKASVATCGGATRPSSTVTYMEAMQSTVVQNIMVVSRARVAHLKRVLGPRALQ
jgi:hypothetical protein